MRRLVAGVVGLACAIGLAAQVASPVGSWNGHIAIPGRNLLVAISLARGEAAGMWSGTIDIPDQAVKAAALGNVVVDGRSVSFAMIGVPGEPRFAGTLSEDGQTIAGAFTQGGGKFPFELRRGQLARPQEPKPPFPYRAEAVGYRNVAANVSLAGTLTLPQGPGRFPAVLLISGSGSQDRDSTIAGHRPFLLLADTLTRRGVAVLRVDDRGIGGSDRGATIPTSADLAGDVRAGLTFLAARPDIDATKLGLIGHSEGAMITAMVAADTPAVRFIVMLAGAGVRGDEILMQQVTAIATAQSAPKAMLDWDLSMRRRVYDQVLAERDGQPDAAARQKLVDSIPAPPGIPDSSIGRRTAEQLLAASSTPWFRFFLSYDPRTSLSKLKVPVLAINGERDLQVPARENVPAIRSALEAAGNASASVHMMPGLNHLLQTAKTGLVTEYDQIEETIAPAVLTLIGDWVVARVK